VPVLTGDRPSFRLAALPPWSAAPRRQAPESVGGGSRASSVVASSLGPALLAL